MSMLSGEMIRNSLWRNLRTERSCVTLLLQGPKKKAAAAKGKKAPGSAVREAEVAEMVLSVSVLPSGSLNWGLSSNVVRCDSRTKLSKRKLVKFFLRTALQVWPAPTGRRDWQPWRSLMRSGVISDGA